MSVECTEKSIVFFSSQNAGEHKVTLVIFSGLPDPVWTVHPRHEKFEEMKRHLDSARSGRNTYRHEHLSPHLGFRGFLVHHPEAEYEELIVGKETKALQKLLLDTMPDEVIPATLRQKIYQAIESEAVSAYLPDASQRASPHDVSQAPTKTTAKTATDITKIQHYAPALNLPRWNKYEVIRRYNNCYNYANGKITNSFAQPGYASGQPIQSLTPEEVLKAAMSDGLLKMDVPPTAPVPEAPEQPNCLIALVVAEGKKISNPSIQTNWLESTF